MPEAPRSKVDPDPDALPLVVKDVDVVIAATDLMLFGGNAAWLKALHTLPKPAQGT